MLKPTLRFLLTSAVVAALAPTSFAAEPTAKESDAIAFARKEKTTVSVSRGNQTLFRYRYADVPMKPCVDQLFSPAGVQVLRDSPHDHKHHHALMFALAADGVDFWAEFPNCGTQKQRSLETINRLVLMPNGQWQKRAGLAEELDWTNPASKQTLLVERREVCVLGVLNAKDADLGATLVEWQSQLETPQGTDSVKLTGSHYFGLGMRFLQSMDGGRFLYADDQPGEVVRGDERLTPAKWCAYAAKADGKPVTVAVFDDPQNIRYPAKMFTMTQPFAYLSATRNEWKEPITLRADKPLEFHYAVAVWDGKVDKPAVERLYQRWLKMDASAQSR
jgi:hypothetical protein